MIKTKTNKKRYYTNFIYVIPLLAVLVPMVIVPSLEIFYDSLFKVELNGDAIFVGLNNFKKVLTTEYIGEVFFNTVLWLLMTVLMKNAFGLGLALLMNRNFHGKKAVNIISMLPWATPWIISAIIFKWIFDGLYGFLNSILFNVGIIDQAIDFLGTSGTSLLCVAITNVWTAIPLCGFTYLSALYSIPEYLYEAAELDGANKWQEFKVITFPLLLPSIELLGLLTTLWSLNSFDMIYVMTGGGPLYSSETLVTLIYRLGYRLNNPGMANALSVITFAIMTLLSAIYIRKGKASEQYV